MSDRADKLTDHVMDRLEAQCAKLYADACKHFIRGNSATFNQLRKLENQKPPANRATPEAQEQWRQEQQRIIIRRSGLARAYAVEIAHAGSQAAKLIQAAMVEVGRINREGDDIG